MKTCNHLLLCLLKIMLIIIVLLQFACSTVPVENVIKENVYIVNDSFYSEKTIEKYNKHINRFMPFTSGMLFCDGPFTTKTALLSIILSPIIVCSDIFVVPFALFDPGVCNSEKLTEDIKDGLPLESGVAKAGDWCSKGDSKACEISAWGKVLQSDSMTDYQRFAKEYPLSDLPEKSPKWAGRFAEYDEDLLAKAEAINTPDAYIKYLSLVTIDTNNRKKASALLAKAIAKPSVSFEDLERYISSYPEIERNLPARTKLMLVGPKGLKVFQVADLQRKGVISSELLASKILSSSAAYKNYDFSELVVLKKSGITDDVINAMTKSTSNVEWYKRGVEQRRVAAEAKEKVIAEARKQAEIELSTKKNDCFTACSSSSDNCSSSCSALGAAEIVTAMGVAASGSYYSGNKTSECFNRCSSEFGSCSSRCDNITIDTNISSVVGNSDRSHENLMTGLQEMKNDLAQAEQRTWDQLNAITQQKIEEEERQKREAEHLRREYEHRQREDRRNQEIAQLEKPREVEQRRQQNEDRRHQYEEAERSKQAVHEAKMRAQQEDAAKFANRQRIVNEARANRKPLGSCANDAQQSNFETSTVSLLACAQREKFNSQQGVQWAIANNTGENVEASFVKRYIFSCGREEARRASLNLKPYETINGGFFQGDLDLGDPLFPDEVCGGRGNTLHQVGVRDFTARVIPWD